MVNSNNLLNGAKQITTYSFVTFMAYFTAIILTIINGFIEEKVIGSLGLNATGTSATTIGTFITAFNTALLAITGILTVVTGLLTLNVILTSFGIKLNFKMGMGDRV
jgi:hypothetical protein